MSIWNIKTAHRRNLLGIFITIPSYNPIAYVRTLSRALSRALSGASSRAPSRAFTELRTEVRAELRARLPAALLVGSFHIVSFISFSKTI
jgi:hypothetical protein